jgi:glycosyltransferase involved in cell wall biosynthesis
MLSNHTAKVSVIIPNYNYAQYLPECITSVLNQSYEQIEIIVVDDGSTDNSMDILKQFGNSIKVISQKNRGQATARNVGIKASSGEWIALLDSDDVWLPHKIETQLNVLKEYPTWQFIGSKHTDTQNCDDNNVSCFPVDLKYFLSNSMAPSSTLLHKNCFETVGYFNEDRAVKGVEDKDLWLRIAQQFAGGILNAPLFRYRQHPEQENRKVAQMISAERAVLRSFFSNHRTSFFTYLLGMGNFFYTAAISLRDDGKEPAKAIPYFMLSLLFCPLGAKVSTWVRIKSLIVSLIRLVVQK